MLLSSVIIILREMLEASILIGLLLTIGQLSQQSKRWIIYGLPIGMTGAIIYARHLGNISLWFNDAGQEVSNALINIIMVVAIFTIIFVKKIMMNWSYTSRLLTFSMTLLLVLATLLEGAEIYVYLSSFIPQSSQAYPVSIGALVGASIGASIGALVYYSLTLVRQAIALPTALFFLALLAAGLLSQAIQLLIQIDWIESRQVWDTSWLIAEDSLTGQLLYATTGYESTPALMQVVVYFFVLVTAAVIIFLQKTTSAITSE